MVEKTVPNGCRCNFHYGESLPITGYMVLLYMLCSLVCVLSYIGTIVRKIEAWATTQSIRLSFSLSYTQSII